MNFFLALISLSLFHSIKSASDVCADGQFACNDGRCITNDWVCDGARDCSDGSDEHHEACDRHMNKNSSCFGNQPECKKHGLARCIPHEWLCDGHPDCDAGEDEYNCTSIDWFRQPESLMRKYQSLLADKSTTTQYFTYCSSNEFRCESSGNCLKPSQLCDGKPDCGKGEDEKNCTKKIENTTVSSERNATALMSTTTKLPVTTSRLENITLNSLLLAKPTTLTTPTSSKLSTTTTTSATTTTSTTTTTPPKTTTIDPITETTKPLIIHIQPTLPSSSYILPTTRSSVPTTSTTITTQKVVARTFATQLHTTQPPKIAEKLLNDSWSNSTADKEKQKEASMTTRASSATEISRYGRKGIGEPVRFVKGIPIEPVNWWNATNDDFE
ncbi:hypothetical protein L5515_019152 [Caenorhabditis briggsae]|uniref:Uncharacterized protein n=1 Tax=Caenorhabditis briggsae TaxID=6238 RepID=A0AAE9FI80_CAEBR|nr:hypothetical protein L5515_019152 [Caenorhabditis briggsae]